MPKSFIFNGVLMTNVSSDILWCLIRKLTLFLLGVIPYFGSVLSVFTSVTRFAKTLRCHKSK
jgi:hypothetical protein